MSTTLKVRSQNLLKPYDTYRFHTAAGNPGDVQIGRLVPKLVLRRMLRQRLCINGYRLLNQGNKKVEQRKTQSRK